MKAERVKILECSCVNTFQDKEYGRFMRVHNEMKDSKGPIASPCASADGHGRLDNHHPYPCSETRGGGQGQENKRRLVK